MRYLLAPILILSAAWMSTPAARGDFQWIEDWQVVERIGNNFFFTDDATQVVQLNVDATFSPPDRDSPAFIHLSRQFEVSNSPLGLSLTLTGTFDATVDRVPLVVGGAGGSATISGTGVLFGAYPTSLGFQQPFHEVDSHDFLLANGIYKLEVVLDASFVINPMAEPPVSAESLATLRVGLEALPVPEPSSAALLMLAVPVAGVWLRRTQRTSEEKRTFGRKGDNLRKKR